MIKAGAVNTALAWLRADTRRFDVAVAIPIVGLGSLLSVGRPGQFDNGWPEWAAVVGAFLLVAVRRTAPLALLAVAVGWTMLHVVTLERPTPMVFAMLALLATACVRLDRWPAIWLGVAIAASLYAMGIVINDAEFRDDRAVIGVAWTGVAVGIADATRSWRRYRQAADAEVRSAVLAAEAQVRQQVSEERLSIARELHDLLAHNLSVMNVQTGAALHLLRSDTDQAEQSLTEARDAGRTVLDELRQLLTVLRHHDGDDAPTASLPSVDQLGSLVDTIRSAGLDVTWTRSGGPRALAPAVSLAAYRIAQEALTNATKHGSGAAAMATEWDDAGLTIRVSNEVGPADGRGAGHGLTGMNERATANGGRLVAERRAGLFVVEAWLPAATDRRVTP